ncbi:MAG: hypothetical protein QNJ55_22765 [Xenococcus sp. MO_188.B8]|nr:hypothetical protein [Xenococcus sp. MO_188.B8]
MTDIQKKFAQRITIIVGCFFTFCLLVTLCFNVSSSQASNLETENLTRTQVAMSGSPIDLPKPKISGKIPTADPVPPGLKSNPRPFFDNFSWESFIALNWPAVSGVRGVAKEPDNPEIFLNASNSTPVVWGTYKEAFELFGQGKFRPAPWSSYDNPINPCDNAKPGKRVFVMASKIGTVLDETNQAFSLPLIDQNKNYARYEVRFNKAQYNFVRGQNKYSETWLYLLKNLAQAQPVQMPESTAEPYKVGAIMLKGAWREMITEPNEPRRDDLSRYYWVEAQVYNPDTKSCVPKKMGLVGMHIVQKLATRPEWIWSTFEQVDNVKHQPGVNPEIPLSFNNGKNEPQTIGGYANRPPSQIPPLQPKSERIPVQVTRFNPIPDDAPHPSTTEINQKYQKLLQETVWKNYQLVFTQWPSKPNNFLTMEQGGIYPQDAGQAFPINNITNAAIETYFQSQNDATGAGGNSCMSCHFRAAQSDFSWSLQGRAHE